jgi:hypothetical protein
VAVAGDRDRFGEWCLWLMFDGCCLDRQRCRGKIAAEDFSNELADQGNGNFGDGED